MAKNMIALLSGAVFGLGLTVAGMTDPVKVQNFLDILGNWDPALMFVLGSAVVATTLGYRWILGKEAPLLDDQFFMPIQRVVDWRLISGSAIFGIGWGLYGFCPGPALANLSLGRYDAFVFCALMMLGSMLARRFDLRLSLYMRNRELRIRVHTSAH